MENYGRYTLLRKLALGGMAEVFLACPAGDPSKQLVIKRILPHLAEDAHFVTMFLNEARIAAQLSHPNIVTLFDLGKEGSSFFLAMEYIYGEDLGALIQSLSERGVLLPIPLAVRIISDACEGLAYAHAKRDLQGRPLQLIHRDISPQNLMVGFDGAVKLLDFGIARAANQSSTTQTGEIKGKYSYIAPEQARGADLDLRCDIFSLGLVLYELLTGISPNKRDNELFTLRAALEGEIQPPGRYADLPSGLEQVVMRAAAREKEDRFATAAEFRQALQPFLGNASEPAMRRLLALTMQTLFHDRLRKEAASGGHTGSFAALPAKTPAAMERELRFDLWPRPKSAGSASKAPPTLAADDFTDEFLKADDSLLSEFSLFDDQTDGGNGSRRRGNAGAGAVRDPEDNVRTQPGAAENVRPKPALLADAEDDSAVTATETKPAGMNTGEVPGGETANVSENLPSVFSTRPVPTGLPFRDSMPPASGARRPLNVVNQLPDSFREPSVSDGEIPEIDSDAFEEDTTASGLSPLLADSGSGAGSVPPKQSILSGSDGDDDDEETTTEISLNPIGLSGWPGRPASPEKRPAEIDEDELLPDDDDEATVASAGRRRSGRLPERAAASPMEMPGSMSGSAEEQTVPGLRSSGSRSLKRLDADGRAQGTYADEITDSGTGSPEFMLPPDRSKATKIDLTPRPVFVKKGTPGRGAAASQPSRQMPQSSQGPWRDAPSDASPFAEDSLADRLDRANAGARRNRRNARHSTSNFSIRSRTSLRQLGMTIRQKFCALLDDADDWGRRYGIPREVMMALVLSAGLFLVIGLALVLI